MLNSRFWPLVTSKYNGMKKQDYMDNKAEDILGSLDKVRRATPQPYLFTRIKARMARGEEQVNQNSRSIFARPAFVLAGLVLVLIVNAFILFRQGSSTESSTLTGQNEQVTADNDYLMATTNSYDFENLEQ